MRVLILILMLFTFAVGIFSDAVHAAAHNHTGSHHLDHNIDADSESCNSDQDRSHDENGCDDCCCVHSHSMATSTESIKMVINATKQSAPIFIDQYDSVLVAGLKRPPRL